MSVSIHFQALIPIDGDTYRKHKAVWDACEADARSDRRVLRQWRA
jgi:hypothetical protein